MKLLLELRPALSGHAGIPQENRLLFRGLCQIEGLEIIGLLQSPSEVIPPGLPMRKGEIRHSMPPHKEVNAMSRVVISLQRSPTHARIENWRRTFRSIMSPLILAISTLLGRRQGLTAFDSSHFKDFIWRGVFAKTLPFEDFATVTRASLRVLCPPYTAMHACGLLLRKLIGRAWYPRLDTPGIDIMISQTPYPARLNESTRLIVRYMDAVPLLMPHTIVHKSFHQALHYNALRCNVESGAYFACASDATRRDLVAIFPKAAPRAVTIHCMLSHHYFFEESSPGRVHEILAKRYNQRFGVPGSVRAFDKAVSGVAAGESINYLLMVSTIEPRKNHGLLLAAWEQIRSDAHPGLKLVIVGGLGWDHELIAARFTPWIGLGDAFLLEDVPAEELRLLYRHARVTVCPSFSEGFDYSGVEAMRCGGVVVASDIDVHREIYVDGAAYFSPYSVAEAAKAIMQLVGSENDETRRNLITKGFAISGKYVPEKILPKWGAFLDFVNRGETTSIADVRREPRAA